MVGVGGRDESTVVFGIGLEEDGGSDTTVPEGRGEVDFEGLNKDFARVKSSDKHPALDFGELLGMDMGIFERRKRKTAH